MSFKDNHLKDLHLSESYGNNYSDFANLFDSFDMPYLEENFFNFDFSLLEKINLDNLQGVNETVDYKTVISVYWPICQLLKLRIENNIAVHNKTKSLFKFTKIKKIPYVIGIVGSVAVGKSLAARVIKAILTVMLNKKVNLVTTDSFLYNNAYLEKNNLLEYKGFPQSYDREQLFEFIFSLKAGNKSFKLPVYSHQEYDIVQNKFNLIENPEILILEGLNLFQDTNIRVSKSYNSADNSTPAMNFREYIDSKIYIDAKENDIELWYLQRFEKLRNTSFNNQDSFFHFFTEIKENEALKIAKSIWETINYANLIENIKPTKKFADVIIKKNNDHTIKSIMLKKH